MVARFGVAAKNLFNGNGYERNIFMATTGAAFRYQSDVDRVCKYFLTKPETSPEERKPFIEEYNELSETTSQTGIRSRLRVGMTLKLRINKGRREGCTQQPFATTGIREDSRHVAFCTRGIREGFTHTAIATKGIGR